jgi:iron complex outermembrane receptor protein
MRAHRLGWAWVAGALWLCADQATAQTVVPAALPIDAGDADAGVDERPAPPANVQSLQLSAAMADAGVATEPSAQEYHAIAVAPAPFASVDLDKVPRNVQEIDARTIADQHALGLHEVLNEHLGSAIINDVQGNPLQPDLQYRGFTASPLLGTPQGIAVYQNGVRINEPFGDVLQWDLIPSFAIADAQLIPGANPVYGLNALGGSLSLRMKDGFNAPGYRVEGMAGSFARYRTVAEYGQSFGDWAVYLGASMFGEQGYRQDSASSAQNLYADVRHKQADHEVSVSLTLGRSDLNGNGPSPIDLLRSDRSAVFTWPDNTQNSLVMVSSSATQQLSSHVAVQGTAYVRHGERDTSNGDTADFSTCPDSTGASVLCDTDNHPLSDEAGRSIAATQPFDAALNTTRTTSDGLGAALQLSVQEPLASRPNHLVVGASYDGSQVEFLQRVEAGWLTPDRTVQGSGLRLSDPSFHTDLEVQNHALGVYAADTWTVAKAFSVQASARVNWLDTHLDDRLGTALDGQHQFVRVNPSLGVTYAVARPLTLFASYSEANRAPSAAELACADPNQPCRVPNAFISDPSLEQVVSRSAEVGLRGRLGSGARPWLFGSLAAFGTRNQNDILFVAGSHVGTGFFQNAGTTQRIGLEASLHGDHRVLRWYASYTLLRATFESDLELPGGANPAATPNADGGDDDSTLSVKRGSRIPGLPTHSVKAGVTVQPTAAIELGLSMLGQSSQPYRGDEASALPSVHGYVIFNAHASYKLFDQMQLFVRAQNLLNTRYSTFGVIASPSDVFPNSSDPRFLGPGAPLGVWAGMVIGNPL